MRQGPLIVNSALTLPRLRFYPGLRKRHRGGAGKIDRFDRVISVAGGVEAAVGTKLVEVAGSAW